MVQYWKVPHRIGTHSSPPVLSSTYPEWTWISISYHPQGGNYKETECFGRFSNSYAWYSAESQGIPAGKEKMQIKFCWPSPWFAMLVPRWRQTIYLYLYLKRLIWASLLSDPYIISCFLAHSKMEMETLHCHLKKQWNLKREPCEPLI